MTSSADETNMETDSWSSRGVCSVAPSNNPGLTKLNSGMTFCCARICVLR